MKFDFFYKTFLLLGLMAMFSPKLTAQLNAIDHWETLLQEDDIWRYFRGITSPPSNWNTPAFNDAFWSQGPGGIGFGDGDDNTIIPQGLSLFMRNTFQVVDTSKIIALVLHADFDDGFVAYLNGVEIARANVDGNPPAYNTSANANAEAEIYRGGVPAAILIMKSDWSQYLNNGPNVLAVQVHNLGASSNDMSARFFLAGAIKDNSMDYRPLHSQFYEPFLSSHLPLIKVNLQGDIPDEPKVTANMEVIHVGSGALNFVDMPGNEYNGFIGIEIRGSSSQGFPKKNFDLETRDSLGNNFNVKLLGMPTENDWIIHGPYSDKSLVRNILAYDLGRKTDRYAPRTRLCEMFINDQYYGVVVLMEKIKRDDDRVDIARIDRTQTTGDALTGGYILQVDRFEPGDGWFSPFAPGHFYEFRDPDTDEMSQTHKTYIENHITAFENVMDGPNFNDPNIGYRKYIDVGSFIDYLIVQELAKNVDAYRLSSFLYKERDSDGGKIVAGPLWDFNLGFGNADYCAGGNTRGWQYNASTGCGGGNPRWWGRLGTDPAFRNEWKCRWEALRQGPFQDDSLDLMIDTRVAEIGVAVDRNFDRWDVLGRYVWPNNFVGNTYTQEINYLKDWVKDRAQWMDNNTPGVCLPNSVANNLESEKSLQVYPNPFSDEVFFEKKDHPNSEVVIFDILGKEVIRLDFAGENSVSWNGRNLFGNPVAPGWYTFSFEEKGRRLESGVLIRD